MVYSYSLRGGNEAYIFLLLFDIITNSKRSDEGTERTTIALNTENFPSGPFKRCLEFLYTGIVEVDKESEELDETIHIACLLNLPELKLICENAKKGEEFLNPSIGTWLNDRNSSIAKRLFLNQPLFSDVSFSVEGEVIRGHKLVLCCRCDVMSAMLSGSFVESRTSEVSESLSNCFIFRSTLLYFLELKKYLNH